MRNASFVLPRHDNAGNDLTDTHLTVRSMLCDLWSGFTALPVEGGWRDPITGRVHLDSGVMYLIAMADTRLERERFEFFVRFYGSIGGQEAVYITHARGDVVVLDCKIRVGVEA